MAKLKKIKQPKLVSKSLATTLTSIACKQFETSTRFKQQRMEDIQANVDLYDNKTKPAGRGRFNVPVPIMAGYVDTLMSKIDEGVKLNFKYTNIANLIKSKKLQATWDKESGPSRGKWDKVDRAVKKNAIFCGVGIMESYAESDPEYKSHLTGIHYLDFHCEPLGGQDIENHLFAGVENVFKGKSELMEGVKSGEYYDWGVEALITRTGKDDTKKNAEIFKNKISIYSNLGLDPENHSYVGSAEYNLNKWVLEHNGVRYYLVFDFFTKTPIKCVKLKDIKPSGKMPWVCWHTHSDLLNFWSKAPADDIRPIAEAINIIFNQALDNRAKRNFGMRAVDPEIFPDLNQFEWRPDGLIQANTGMGAKAISSGIYEIKTEEVSGTIDLINWMDTMAGQKSGVTADAQGESDEKRVGIYYGNLQQVADRLGLYNKSYAEAHVDLGMSFQEGVRYYMTEGYMVRWIGEDGAISEGEMEREDAIVEGEGSREDFDIDVVGGQAEMRADEIKKQSRKESLAAILSNENLASRVNPTWAIKEILSTGDYEKEEIQMALDVNSDGSMEQISRASRAIQVMLKGVKPKKVRTADTSFISYINDYAIDEVDDEEIFQLMMTYAAEHMPIAMDNMARKARMARPVAPMDPTMAGGGAGAMLPKQTPNTPGGTASRSAVVGATDVVPGAPSSLSEEQ